MSQTPQGPGSGGPPHADALESMGADTDPTKPVFFSIQDEFTNLPDDRWQNLALLRVDAVLGGARPGGRPRGLLLRADLPLATFDDGFDTTTGLGDVYGQALVFPGLFPSFSSPRGVVAGSARGKLSVRTSSDLKGPLVLPIPARPPAAVAGSPTSVLSL